MNIVLISLYDKIALGLRSVSAYLKAHGHNTYIIYFKNYRQVRLDQIKEPLGEAIPAPGGQGVPEDLHIQIKEDGRYALGYPRPPTYEEYGLLIKILRELRPDLIGISLTYIHRHIAIKISKEIKKSYPAPIVWGGVDPTLEPEHSLQYADIVLRGEGEEAMLELADRLDRGEDINNIQNIWLRSDHEIIQNSIRPLIKDLDTLPFIDTTPENKYGIEGNRLWKNEWALSNNPSRKNYDIMTNRGCPYRCSYCVNHQLKRLYKGSPPIRQRSVSHVISELIEAKKMRPIEFIEFMDDIFPTQREWVKEFSYLYKEKIGIPFCCYLHPNHVDDKNLVALRDCGLRHAVIGIQSGSEHILYDIFRRPTSTRRMLDAVKKLSQENIFTYFDIITENPFEEDGDQRATLSLLLKIPPPFGINLSRLSLFPGTEIRRLSEKGRLPKRSGKANAAKQALFWSNLYLLSVQRFIPRSIISLFSRLNFLRHHPKYLEFILRLYVRLKNMKRAFL